MVISAFYLKKRAVVLLKLTMEIAFVDTTAAEADVTEMTKTTWLQMIDRCLQVELMAFHHERLDGASEDIAIRFDLGDTVAVINLAIGTDRDTAKTTIPVGLIRCMPFHKVDVLCIGIDLVFDVDDPFVKLAILGLGVMRVAPL